MSDSTDAIRAHHRALLERLGDTEAALARGESANLPALVTLLREELLPHAQGEERAFYPKVDALIAEHGRPTATMSIEHEFIEAALGEVVAAAERARAAAGDARPSARAATRERLHDLLVLLRVHVAKEERVYLPAIERYLSDAEQAAILDAMHGVDG